MKRITLFHNKECDKCRRIARTHKFFDWFDRIEISTEEPRTGLLQLGEIAVEDISTGEITKGVDAVRSIARQIPLYLPLQALSYVPSLARYLDKQAKGCADGSCEVPKQRLPV